MHGGSRKKCDTLSCKEPFVVICPADAARTEEEYCAAVKEHVWNLVRARSDGRHGCARRLAGTLPLTGHFSHLSRPSFREPPRSDVRESESRDPKVMASARKAYCRCTSNAAPR